MDSLKPLSIKDALELHRLVSPHIPDYIDGETDAIELIRKIVDSMRDTNPQSYLDSILLMSGMSLDDLQQMNSIDILKLFVDGMTENRILTLDSFCKRIGLKHA